MRIHKKTVVIEAVQLRWDNWSEMCKFADVGGLINHKPEGCYMDKEGHCVGQPTDTIGMWVPTEAGLLLAHQDDWIIKGVSGELYLCKPDVFKKTYEVLDD